MRKPLLVAAVAALAATALPAAARSQTKDCGQLPGPYDGLLFTGDGDTLYGAGFGPPIRLWGVQAPELRDTSKQETVTGMRARALVEDLLAANGYKAHVEPAKWDRYCRAVAVVTVGGKEPALELIRAGLGYGFYLSETKPYGEAKSVAYGTAEAAARKARLGLWPQWLGEAK
jgi:endonuclease YncB( thermonuclease family)